MHRKNVQVVETIERLLEELLNLGRCIFDVHSTFALEPAPEISADCFLCDNPLKKAEALFAP